MDASTPKYAGFTLVELLIVIAIIGLLSTLAVTGVTVTRSKARDAKRSADIAQIQKAMALYATGQSRYPIAATEACLTGTDAASAELVAKGVMRIVPGDPMAKSTLPAAAGSGAHCYAYQSASGTTYTMRYRQERASDRGPAGATITVGP
ncbi:MAG: prepilin-type N-terminal cleavage/methylation domain-containing protein [bacterium]|nr:prepilin-type N-terminal cleavage/methylation domain-containing protein [bacterium]MDP3771575.1 prepilin-type N-terminal cleavage/methylation domain-containing protein [bacterium]